MDDEHASQDGTISQGWRPGGQRLDLKSRFSAVSINESRNVGSEHPEGEPRGKHIQAVQPGRSRLPCDAVYYSKNDNDSDPIGSKRAHLTIPLSGRPAAIQWIFKLSTTVRRSGAD